MTKRPLIAFLLLPVIGLSSCMGRVIKKVDSPASGAIIGNLKVPGGYRYINLNKLGVVYAAPFKSPPQAYADRNGNFIFENLSPGKYYLLNVSDGRQVYAVATSKDQVMKNLIEVKPGQIVFIGSIVFANLKRGVVRASTFEIKRVDKPDERTILRELIPQAKDTGWDKRLQARLSALK